MDVPHLTLTAYTEGLVTLRTCCLQLLTLIYEAKGALWVQEDRAVRGLTRHHPHPSSQLLWAGHLPEHTTGTWGPA